MDTNEPDFMATLDSDAAFTPKQPKSLAPPETGSDLTSGPDKPVVSSVQESRRVAQPASGPVGSSLLDITRQIHAVELAIVDQNGELTPELEERLSVATIAREQKVDAYSAVIERCTSIQAEYTVRADRMAAVAAAAKSIVTRLKDNLKLAIRSLELKELQGEAVRFQLVTSNKVELTDASLLPGHFLRQKITYEPDLIAIGLALKAGQEVPGARLTNAYSLRTGAPRKGPAK